MSDLIDRQTAIDEILLNLTCCDSVRDLYEATVADKYDDYKLGLVDAIDVIIGLTSAQPEQKNEELLPDGTLHLFADADLSKVCRVLVSQNGTHYVGLYYADEQPTVEERQRAKNIYYEERDHCEFRCSLCGATIGVVEGGTLDGANFKFCPWCGAQLDEEVRAWDA